MIKIVCSKPGACLCCANFLPTRKLLIPLPCLQCRPARCEPCFGGADCRAGCRVSFGHRAPAFMARPRRAAAPRRARPYWHRTFRTFGGRMLAGSTSNSTAQTVTKAVEEWRRGGGKEMWAGPRAAPCPLVRLDSFVPFCLSPLISLGSRLPPLPRPRRAILRPRAVRVAPAL